MNTPNLIGWIIVCLTTLFNLCYSSYMHGKPNGNYYNFWVTFISSIFSIGLFILIWWK